MNTIRISVCAPGLAASVLGLTALVGCAARPPFVVHDTVGPRRQGRHADGELVVYSATYVTAANQSLYPAHSDYTVCDQQGRPYEVRNRSGLFGSDPAQVHLLPGRYEVKALRTGAGYVVVPVVIEAGEKTVLDLDGTAMPQQAARNDVVRLPDGQVIGWRATAE
jgi:hypothetical protein